MAEQRRELRLAFEVDVVRTLAAFSRGRSDPAHQVSADGVVWRAARTPSGPATIRVEGRTGTIEATAWGPGAAWMLERLPAWLGTEDDPSAFHPVHAVLDRAVKAQRGLRIGRSGLVMDALIPSILEQKVTGKEARLTWRRLLTAHGEPAPGPAPSGMRVLPEPDVLRMLPSWEWHRLGVGPDRSRAVVSAARVAGRLEEAAAMTPEDASRRLRAVSGIGPWTAAEVIQRALGDPDQVSVGDYGIPRLVAYALAGERTADDERMLELLEPYRGQRYRACLLLERSGVRPPRRGPRMPIRDYRRM